MIFFASFALADSSGVVQSWWLGHWGRAYLGHSPSEVDVPFYLTTYGVIVVSGMIVYSAGFAVYVFGSIRASRKIHNMLLDAILGTTLRWLDSTPIGRIVSRFTQDIRNVDG